MIFGFKKKRREQTITVEAILKVLWNVGEKMTVSAIRQEMERYYGTVYRTDEVQESINEACAKGLIIEQTAKEEMRYYPAMSEAVYNEERLQEYEKAMASCPAKSYVMPMSSRKLTEEEYERLKKLIDELE